MALVVPDILHCLVLVWLDVSMYHTVEPEQDAVEMTICLQTVHHLVASPDFVAFLLQATQELTSALGVKP